jgi:hypothetical protein
VGFVVALKDRGYLHADGKLTMSGGIYLYLYELYQDGWNQHGSLSH